jgi:diketogulonate reductase-like aldo/keto reductase
MGSFVLEKLLSVADVSPAVDQVERHPYFQQKHLAAFLAGHAIVPEAWYPLGPDRRRDGDERGHRP